MYAFGDITVCLLKFFPKKDWFGKCSSYADLDGVCGLVK